MSRKGVFVVCLAMGMAALGGVAHGDTYYVESDESSVNANLDVSFSASGYLKLVLFDPNGILDFLNPKADSMAGIYATMSEPSSAAGTLDAAVAGDELTLSGMDLDLLADGPRVVQAGADIHVDAIPFLADILEPIINQIDPNWIDPNVINDVIAALTAGFDFDYDFEMTVNSMGMVQTGDPVSATIVAGAFENLIPWAEVVSQLQFNGGDPIDLPAVPLPFILDGTYTDVPVDTLTLTGPTSEGGIDTPEVVIIDRLIDLPIGESGIDVTFQINLQIDAGTAQYQLTPSIAAVTGYLLTTDVDPAATGTIVADPVGPEYPPGTVVELTPTPAEGWNFSEWSGDLSGSDNPATIAMDGHKSVTASFVEDQVLLTINTTGDGSVIALPTGPLYDVGTSVSLSPVAGIGWEFSGWEGDIEAGQEDDNPLVIVMDADKEITAVFEESGTCGTGAGLPLAVSLLLCTVAVIRRRW